LHVDSNTRARSSAQAHPFRFRAGAE
jgi:hypothetical protein